MNNRTKSSAISVKQLKLLHVAKRELNLEDEDYRAILARYGRVDSSSDLDGRGFNAVMKYFTALGFRSTWTKRTYGERAGMASPAQVDLIRSLWRDFSGKEDPSDMALHAWLDKHHHVTALRFVNTEKASKVIHSLKAMVHRKRATG